MNLRLSVWALVFFLSPTASENECESFDGNILAVFDEMNTNVIHTDTDTHTKKKIKLFLWMTSMANFPKSNNTLWPCIKYVRCELNTSETNGKPTLTTYRTHSQSSPPSIDCSHGVHWFFRLRCYCFCCCVFSPAIFGRAWEFSSRIKTMWPRLFIQPNSERDKKNEINYGWKRIKTPFVPFFPFFFVCIRLCAEGPLWFGAGWTKARTYAHTLTHSHIKYHNGEKIGHIHLITLFKS